MNTLVLWVPFLLFVVLAVVLTRFASEPDESRPILSAIQPRTAESVFGLDLMRRKTFVFVSLSGPERRLDHRIEDEDGSEIGSVLEQPRPAWWEGNSNLPRIGRVRLEVCDESGAKVVEIVRPFGPSLRALSVIDGCGVPVGTIRRSRWRRFALRDRFGQDIGTIVRKGRGYSVDYVIEGSGHGAVATICDFRHIAHRLELNKATAGSRSVKNRPERWRVAEEHVLEINAPVTEELRVLMLGAAAAVYLTLQPPFFDNG
jgi:hypothetical protein